MAQARRQTDLHAAPGKQNHNAHAGTSGPANFFGDPHNQRCTITALKILATHLKTFSQAFHPPLLNIIGIELLNEPVPPSDEPLRDVTAPLSRKSRVLIQGTNISWGLLASGDVCELHSQPPPVHDYKTPDSDGSSSVPMFRPIRHINTRFRTYPHIVRLLHWNPPKQLAEAAEMVGRAGGGLVVGEWSAAMNPGSLGGSYDEHREQQREWVEAQLALYDRVCTGWFFWTYKKQRRSDFGWSWRDAVEACVFPDFVAVRKREGFSYYRDDAKSQQALEAARRSALNQHIAYWAKYPGKYDHARFSSG